MKEKKMTPADIVHKLECIEREAKELREAIVQSMSEATQPTGRTPDVDFQYTLEDLYRAFGSRKHYAIRLKQALARRGITTLADFLALSPGELLELDNVGRETLLKTKKALDNLGIRW